MRQSACRGDGESLRDGSRRLLLGGAMYALA